MRWGTLVLALPKALRFIKKTKKRPFILPSQKQPKAWNLYKGAASMVIPISPTGSLLLPAPALALLAPLPISSATAAASWRPPPFPPLLVLPPLAAAGAGPRSGGAAGGGPLRLPGLPRRRPPRQVRRQGGRGPGAYYPNGSILNGSLLAREGAARELAALVRDRRADLAAWAAVAAKVVDSVVAPRALRCLGLKKIK